MSYSWHITGNRIRDCRKEKHLTQEKLAEYLEQITGNPTKRQTVAKWENGTPVKKIEQLTALCEIFDCDIAYLLCECDTKHIKTESMHKTLGISEKAVDALIEFNKINSRLSDTISSLLENKAVLYQLHDCCSAFYHSYNFEADYADIFSDKKTMILNSKKIEKANFMMLYDSLCDFVDKERKRLGLSAFVE